MAVVTVLSPTDPFFAGKPFDWDGRLFTTVADFEAYLANPHVKATLDAWANRVTVHHTWIPTLANWAASGVKNGCKGMIKQWRDVNGWTTGPNMIICPEGIILASGVDGPGIHAGVCNGTSVGIEIVGNYDYSYWKEPILSLVFGAVIALARVMKMTPVTVVADKLVNGHRECLPNKSCPGNGIDLDKFRRDVAAKMAITPQTDATVIGVPPSITAEQFKKYLAKYGAAVPPGELDRVFTYLAWLQVDPAFLAACWKQEAFVDDPTDNRPATAVIGGSELQRQSHCPLNIVESADTFRATVTYNGRKFRKWNTWQYGLFDAGLYLKQVYGDVGLLNVRQIVPVLAPSSDGNDPEQYITNVLVRMKEMQTL